MTAEKNVSADTRQIVLSDAGFVTIKVEKEKFGNETCKSSYYCGDLSGNRTAGGPDRDGDRFGSFYEKLLDGDTVSCDWGGGHYDRDTKTHTCVIEKMYKD